MRAAVRRAVWAAVLARALLAGLLLGTPDRVLRWQRTNHRGTSVSLLSGPALALAVVATSRALGPSAVAGLGAAVVGGYDDAAGLRDGAKGFTGHLRAARSGRITAGAVKVVGIGLTGVLAARTMPTTRPRTGADTLLAGAVVAAAANVLNLFDLRPGRALKVGLVAGAVLGEPGIAGTCVGLLPADLQERTMLGDAGANALGAVLGVGLLRRLAGRPARAAALLVLAALTAASESVSFSAVIDSSPPLRWLDQLGRRP